MMPLTTDNVTANDGVAFRIIGKTFSSGTSRYDSFTVVSVTGTVVGCEDYDGEAFTLQATEFISGGAYFSQV